MPFEEFYSLIIAPYAQYFRTIRLSVEIIPDEDAAKVLRKATGANAVGLYHPVFQLPSGSLEGDAQNLDWMRHTSDATIYLLKNHSLSALGVYSEHLLAGKFRIGRYRRPLFILPNILQSPAAQKSLKTLEINLPGLSMDAYNLIRRNFTSLKSLTINGALILKLGFIWEPSDIKWASNSNLTRLQFKRCDNVYAPRIHHLVRHFVSLKHLIISECGYKHNDKSTFSPVDGWFSANDALWKVRAPLDTFWLEHMDDWEIGCMGEIPARTLIVSNLKGSHLTKALSQDMNYFPGLETIMIEPHRSFSFEEPDQKSSHIQFDADAMNFLKEYCQTRGIIVLEDAKPTTFYFRHS